MNRKAERKQFGENVTLAKQSIRKYCDVMGNANICIRSGLYHNLQWKSGKLDIGVAGTSVA